MRGRRKGLAFPMDDRLLISYINRSIGAADRRSLMHRVGSRHCAHVALRCGFSSWQRLWPSLTNSAGEFIFRRFGFSLSLSETLPLAKHGHMENPSALVGRGVLLFCYLRRAARGPPGRKLLDGPACGNQGGPKLPQACLRLSLEVLKRRKPNQPCRGAAQPTVIPGVPRAAAAARCWRRPGAPHFAEILPCEQSCLDSAEQSAHVHQYGVLSPRIR
jgi:hypothetical protein